MTIKPGDKLPDATLMHLTDAGPAPISTEELFGGKTVALFAVPGAFTPTCSNQHLPGFIEKSEELRAAGVDTIVCMSVNDAFVMGAWGEAQNASEILMLADGNGELAKAMDVELDLSKRGLGVRGKRFALVAEDGVVKHLALQDGGELTTSSAEEILKVL